MKEMGGLPAEEAAAAAASASASRASHVTIVHSEVPSHGARRFIRAPRDVDIDNVRASVENGVLTIRLPKRSAAL
jgi:HSP20 family molecular chaperone IbpA